MVRRALRISNLKDFELTINMLSKLHPLNFASNQFPFEGHCENIFYYKVPVYEDLVVLMTYIGTSSCIQNTKTFSKTYLILFYFQ